MSGVTNTTARQFNIKAVNPKNKHRVIVRIAPGFNSVNNEHWAVASQCAYAKQLKKDGDIKYGKDQDDQELESEPDTKSKSKSEAPPPAAKD